MMTDGFEHYSAWSNIFPIFDLLTLSQQFEGAHV